MSNPYNHIRGTICVARMSNGQLQALKIESNWKEWSGAFSLI